MLYRLIGWRHQCVCVACDDVITMCVAETRCSTVTMWTSQDDWRLRCRWIISD